jgi:hypothetical protein
MCYCGPAKPWFVITAGFAVALNLVLFSILAQRAHSTRR